MERAGWVDRFAGLFRYISIELPNNHDNYVVVFIIIGFCSGLIAGMKSTLQNDPVLRFFKDAIVARLGHHLHQVTLFGSRARGDATEESDYDLLVVVDRIDSSVTKWIDAIAGQVLVEYGAVLSAFPITEQDRTRRRHSPMLINASREGIAI